MPPSFTAIFSAVEKCSGRNKPNSSTQRPIPYSAQRYFCSQLSFSFFLPTLKFPHYPCSWFLPVPSIFHKVFAAARSCRTSLLAPTCSSSLVHLLTLLCCSSPSILLPSSIFFLLLLLASVSALQLCILIPVPLTTRPLILSCILPPPLPTHKSLVFYPFHPFYLLQTSINSKKLIAFTVSSHRSAHFSLCSQKMKVGIVLQTQLCCAAVALGMHQCSEQIKVPERKSTIWPIF